MGYLIQIASIRRHVECKLSPRMLVVNYTNATSQHRVSSPLGVFPGDIQLVRARRASLKLLRYTGWGNLKKQGPTHDEDF